MKRAIFVWVLAFSLWQQSALCWPEEVFREQLDRAAGQVVNSWLANDRQALADAVTRLTRYEFYNAAIDDCHGSYLCQIPPSLINRGEDSLAAYIFLIRKEGEGDSLWPMAFFDHQQPRNRRSRR